MHAVRTILSPLWGEDEGATIVEYGLLISLIAVAAFAGVAASGPHYSSSIKSSLMTS